MSRKEPQPSRGPRRKHAAALAYDPHSDQAPRVVAAGQGLIAEHIVAIAEAQGVPVRADGELAALLARLDVGSEIPVALYAAVAEILVFLHRHGQQSIEPGIGQEAGL